MADITECPVCFEEFEDPKLLPCNHTLCLECLENVRKEKSLTCPMCNSKHDVPDTGVVAFSDNPHVTQLIANRKVGRSEHLSGSKFYFNTAELDPDTDELNNMFEIAVRYNFYRPRRNWGKVIFSQASMILFTGVCLVLGGIWSQHALQVSRPTPKGEV